MGATTANDENGLDIISAADVGISEYSPEDNNYSTYLHLQNSMFNPSGQDTRGKINAIRTKRIQKFSNDGSTSSNNRF